ncbi:MAG: hypothetical protein CL760_09170 [Chloroflexi bacterium]|nr:hypothetical protein [Chloroflexota bacterium]|tara:strand:- start:26903 stop:27181 length:279 start_codon:yes stop_codon:yes gene_type:complete
MLTAKVFLIVTTTVSMVNGDKFAENVVERVTPYTSYSECKDAIRADSKRYNAERKDKRKRKDTYTYKKIKCKSKRIDLAEGGIAKELFKIRF